MVGCCIVLEEKGGTPILRALCSSPNFRHMVKFGVATEKDAQILRSLKVTEFPALVAFTEHQETWQYQVELTYAAITQWVSELFSLEAAGVIDVDTRGGCEELFSLERR